MTPEERLAYWRAQEGETRFVRIMAAILDGRDDRDVARAFGEPDVKAIRVYRMALHDELSDLGGYNLEGPTHLTRAVIAARNQEIVGLAMKGLPASVIGARMGISMNKVYSATRELRRKGSIPPMKHGGDMKKFKEWERSLLYGEDE